MTLIILGPCAEFTFTNLPVCMVGLNMTEIYCCGSAILTTLVTFQYKKEAKIIFLLPLPHKLCNERWFKKTQHKHFNNKMFIV